MGLGTSTKKIFVNTFKGSLRVKAQANDPDAISRTNKEGNVVWEQKHGYVSGHITGIEVTDHKKFGKQLEISMHDDGNEFVLSVSALSGYAFAFYNRMENINFDQIVKFEMWGPYTGNDGKQRYFLAPIQNGELVSKKYGKDQIPAWELVTIDNEERFDKTKAFKFFMKKLEAVIKQLGQFGNTAKDVKAEATAPLDELEDDDLPF